MENKLNEILNSIHDINYGWVDKDGIKHTQAKKNFFLEFYRLMPVEDTLKYRVATCFEMAALVKHYIDLENIPGDNYIVMYNTDEKIARHATCVAYLNDAYYLLENSWILENPVRKFDTLNELLLFMIWRFPKMYKIEPLETNLIEVYKYTSPEAKLSYKEFIDYVKENGEKIEVTY